MTEVGKGKTLNSEAHLCFKPGFSFSHALIFFRHGLRGNPLRIPINAKSQASNAPVMVFHKIKKSAIIAY